MIASMLVLPLAALAAQGASDTTRTAREAYTSCLRGFVERSLEGNMTAAAFHAALPAAMHRAGSGLPRRRHPARDRRSRATRANAEQSATDEIDEAKLNFRERFEMMLPEPAAAPAAAASAATPPTQPAPAAQHSAIAGQRHLQHPRPILAERHPVPPRLGEQPAAREAQRHQPPAADLAVQRFDRRLRLRRQPAQQRRPLARVRAARPLAAPRGRRRSCGSSPSPARPPPPHKAAPPAPAALHGLRSARPPRARRRSPPRPMLRPQSSPSHQPRHQPA